MLKQAKGLANHAPDARPLNGVSDAPAHPQTDPCPGQAVGGDVHGHRIIRSDALRVQYTAEIGVFADALVRTKRRAFGHETTGRPRVPRVPLPS